MPKMENHWRNQIPLGDGDSDTNEDFVDIDFKVPKYRDFFN